VTFKGVPDLPVTDLGVKLVLTLAGKRSVATRSFSLSRRARHSRIPTVYVEGGAPLDYSATEVNRFTFSGLSPGDYRLYGEVRVECGGGARVGPCVGSAKVLRSLTLGKNEFLVVGEVVFDEWRQLETHCKHRMEKRRSSRFGFGTGPDRE
jgi:hypothetical protein